MAETIITLKVDASSAAALLKWVQEVAKLLDHVADNRACPAAVRSEAEQMLLAAGKLSK